MNQTFHFRCLGEVFHHAVAVYLASNETLECKELMQTLRIVLDYNP